MRYPLSAYPEPFAALSAALSDGGAYLSGSLGGCVTEALADALSASTATYVYELDDPNFVWAASLSPSPLPVGASHSSDLAYLFDSVGLVLNEPFGAGQVALAQQMIGAWSTFVRDGSPGAVGGAAWPGYDAQTRQMLHLEPDATQLTRDFGERHNCSYWLAAPEPSAEEGASSAPVPLDLSAPALDPDLAFLAQDWP